jgi:hypothetical protein
VGGWLVATYLGWELCRKIFSEALGERSERQVEVEKQKEKKMMLQCPR